MRYQDTWQTDRLIVNNGCDTEYDLAYIWECEKPILKKEYLFDLFSTTYVRKSCYS